MDEKTGIKQFTNYKDLLKEQLDVLFVCLTNDIAPEVTMAGLENGLHVFCEKPPGKNLRDIANVMECEQKHPSQKLMYGFNHRFHYSIIESKRIIESGELGKIVNVRGMYGKSKILTFSSEWRTQRAIAGGGILLDQGIHMIDLIRHFVGEIDQIHSFISNDFWRHDVEDNAFALMKSKNGVIVSFSSTATQWRHKFRLEITLEKGSIDLSGILSGSKSYGAEKITIAYRGETDAGDPKEVTIRYNEDNSWRDEIAEFADAIIQNRPITSGSSKDAFSTMELVYRIYCADPEWKKRYNLTDNI